MTINRALSNDRTMKALTGMSIEEFEGLLPGFESALLEQKSKQKRQRKVGAGPKGALKDSSMKLLFILFYLKVYPTFDLAGVLFDVDRSRPCRWVGTFLPILEKLLGYQCDLPKRRIRSMQQFQENFPEIKDIFLDGSERAIQRPSSPKNQKGCYSGKKKSHTRKNLILCDQSKRILLVSPIKKGSIHDKTLLEKECWAGFIPEEVTLWADKGFEGIAKLLSNADRLMMPKKKPKAQELSEQDKKQNRLISGLRILVEHAIAGIKRMGAVKDIYRNRKGQPDQFILLSAALWNYHLRVS